VFVYVKKNVTPRWALTLEILLPIGTGTILPGLLIMRYLYLRIPPLPTFPPIRMPEVLHKSDGSAMSRKDMLLIAVDMDAAAAVDVGEESVNGVDEMAAEAAAVDVHDVVVEVRDVLDVSFSPEKVDRAAAMEEAAADEPEAAPPSAPEPGAAAGEEEPASPCSAREPDGGAEAGAGTEAGQPGAPAESGAAAVLPPQEEEEEEEDKEKEEEEEEEGASRDEEEGIRFWRR